MKKTKFKPLNVMFGDLGYFNRQTVHNQYLPLGIGLIAQYSKQDKEVASMLIDLSECERVDLQNREEKKSLNISYDVIN